MKKIKSVAAGLYLGIAAIGLTSVSAHDANAMVIAADLTEFAAADTFITRDMVSGLDWLDLPLTMSISYDSITTGGTLTGGALIGQNPISGPTFAANPFRHATQTEVIALFTNAGIPFIDAWFWDANRAATDHLKTLLGPTGNLGGDFEFAFGMTATSLTAGTHIMANINDCRSTLSDCHGSVNAGASYLSSMAHSAAAVDNDSEAVTTGGHFLVRASSLMPIPEPSSLAIFVLGLAGMGAMRRRRAA